MRWFVSISHYCRPSKTDQTLRIVYCEQRPHESLTEVLVGLIFIDFCVMIKSHQPNFSTYLVSEPIAVIYTFSQTEDIDWKLVGSPGDHSSGYTSISWLTGLSSQLVDQSLTDEPSIDERSVQNLAISPPLMPLQHQLLCVL